MFPNDRQHVVLAFAGEQMLVDRGVADVAKSFFMAGRHHDLVPFRRTAKKVRALYCRARRTAADDAAALEHVVNCRLRLGAEVRIDQAPLASATEPHRLGIAQHDDELVAVGNVAIARVQQMHIGRAGPLEHLHRTCRFIVLGSGAGTGHNNDLGIAAAGRREKPVEDYFRHHATADDDQRAVGRAKRGRSLGLHRRAALQQQCRRKKREEESMFHFLRLIEIGSALTVGRCLARRDFTLAKLGSPARLSHSCGSVLWSYNSSPPLA